MSNKHLSSVLRVAGVATALSFSLAPVWSRDTLPQGQDEDRLSPAVPSTPVPSQSTVLRPVEEVKPLSEVVTSGPVKRFQIDQPVENESNILSTAVFSYCNPNTYCFGGNRTCIEETFFNFSGPNPGVQWRICLSARNDTKGYEVGPVDLKYAQGPWMRVLYRAGLAE